MATIRYYLKNKNRQLTKVYMRISITRNIQANFPIEHFVINPKHWDDSTMRVKSNFKSYKEINKTLDALFILIEDIVATNYSQMELFNSKYFKDVYDNFINNGNKSKRYVDVLEFIDSYIKNLKLKENTIDIYITTYNKIIQFLKDEKSKDNLFYNDINDKWIREFTEYLKDHPNQKLGVETINTYLSKIKVLLLKYSKENTIFKLPIIEGLKKKDRIIFPYFSEHDLEILESKDFENDRLNNVRDWILIGCETSLRISDFETLTNFNFEKQSVISFFQVKTGNLCLIPITDRLRRIYTKRNGLPSIISEQKFNEYMKEVCELVGFDEVFEGGKLIEIGKNSEGKNMFRKVSGFYKRYELITSHSCRRSFATNKYLEGKLKDYEIMDITGHKSSEEFYKYIQLKYIQKLKKP